MNEWSDAEQRIERAQQLCESKQWVEALEEIDKALELNAANGSWWSSKGYLLDRLELYEDAIEAYEAALECDPDDRENLTALGLNCIRTGQLPRAVEIFDYVQQLDPDHEPAYCHRIMLYAELGEHDLAEQMFYLAQQIDESCPHCFWHLGGSLWYRGDINRAINCWQKVLEIEPTYRDARRRIADAYRRLGDVELARSYYLAEYREDPGNVELLVDLGTLCLENGQHDGALAKFNQVLELDPYHARAQELIGDTFCQSGRDTGAVQAYEQAAQLDQSLPGLHYKLGSKLMKLRQFKEAKNSFLSELALQPNDRDTLMAAGNCALELGETDEAQHCFEHLIAVDDCLPGAYHNLGVCHFMRDEYEEGIKLCSAALELKDDYALARHKLILAHMHLGRWRQAGCLLEESLTVNPEHSALQKLKRTWKFRRIAAWARRLGRQVKKLARRDDS